VIQTSSLRKGLVCLTFFLLLLCMISPISADESSDVIEQQSKYFTVGYVLSEKSEVSYWMLWNSENMAKVADVPPDNPLILERFRNAVDTCLIYETKFNKGIVALIAGCLSPFIWAVTVPEMMESWKLAENAADTADYYFAQL